MQSRMKYGPLCECVLNVYNGNVGIKNGLIKRRGPQARLSQSAVGRLRAPNSCRTVQSTRKIPSRALHRLRAPLHAIALICIQKKMDYFKKVLIQKYFRARKKWFVSCNLYCVNQQISYTLPHNSLPINSLK